MNDMLGKTGTDRITGFFGTITAYAEYITGCNQILLTPKVKEDGTMTESCWVDVQRVEFADTPKFTLANEDSPGHGPAAPGGRQI